MAKKRVMGVTFLHRHPMTEKALGIDKDHVMVDRKDWEEVCDYIIANPEKFKDLLENKVNKPPTLES